jgi:hypothetical protein
MFLPFASCSGRAFLLAPYTHVCVRTTKRTGVSMSVSHSGARDVFEMKQARPAYVVDSIPQQPHLAPRHASYLQPCRCRHTKMCMAHYTALVNLFDL